MCVAIEKQHVHWEQQHQSTNPQRDRRTGRHTYGMNRSSNTTRTTTYAITAITSAATTPKQKTNKPDTKHQWATRWNIVVVIMMRVVTCVIVMCVMVVVVCWQLLLLLRGVPVVFLSLPFVDDNLLLLRLMFMTCVWELPSGRAHVLCLLYINCYWCCSRRRDVGCVCVSLAMCASVRCARVALRNTHAVSL